MGRGNLSKFLKRSQGVLEDLWPAEVSIAGVSYKAACVGLSSEGTLAAGGYAEDVNLVIKVSKEFLAVKPADGELLTYRGEEYRIITIPDLLEPTWTIQCGARSE